MIPTGEALKLRALIDFNDNGTQRIAGDVWQIEGPRTYYPRPECKQIDYVLPMVIEFGKALRLKAKEDLVDRDGIDRVTGILYFFKPFVPSAPFLYLLKTSESLRVF